MYIVWHSPMFQLPPHRLQLNDNQTQTALSCLSLLAISSTFLSFTKYDDRKTINNNRHILVDIVLCDF